MRWWCPGPGALGGARGAVMWVASRTPRPLLAEAMANAPGANDQPPPLLLGEDHLPQHCFECKHWPCQQRWVKSEGTRSYANTALPTTQKQNNRSNGPLDQPKGGRNWARLKRNRDEKRLMLQSIFLYHKARMIHVASCQGGKDMQNPGNWERVGVGQKRVLE